MTITFSAATVAKMAFELALGMSIKLFIENGRLSWADFQNDYLFWMPGVDAQDGDGISRTVEVLVAELDFPETEAAAVIAAK